MHLDNYETLIHVQNWFLSFGTCSICICASKIKQMLVNDKYWSVQQQKTFDKGVLQQNICALTQLWNTDSCTEFISVVWSMFYMYLCIQNKQRLVNDKYWSVQQQKTFDKGVLQQNICALTQLWNTDSCTEFISVVWSMFHTHLCIQNKQRLVNGEYWSVQQWQLPKVGR